MKRLLFLIVPMLLCGQEAKSPEIPVELRARYWKAQLEMVQAEAAVERARANARTAIAAMTSFCGALPTADPDGEPACPKTETETKK